MGMTINSIANDRLQSSFLQLATGKKINSASDDAAGLAALQALNSEIDGLSKGTDNTYDMGNLLNTAEGGLSSINDNLQRMRELSVQASNGTLSDSDKSIINEEINQLKQQINDTVGLVEFNGMKLLDGSFQNKNTASDANGRGKSVSIDSLSIDTLGLTDYSVSGSFDISDIDNAIDMVSSARSSLGAVTNTFKHTINSNEITNLNLAASRSRIADTDYAKSFSEMNKNRILGDAQIYMQKQQMNLMGSTLSLMK